MGRSNLIALFLFLAQKLDPIRAGYTSFCTLISFGKYSIRDAPFSVWL